MIEVTNAIRTALNNGTCNIQYRATIGDYTPEEDFDYDYSRIPNLNNWRQREMDVTVTYLSGMNSFVLETEEAFERFVVAVSVKKNTDYSFSFNYTTSEFTEGNYGHAGAGVASEMPLSGFISSQSSIVISSSRINSLTNGSVSISFNSGNRTTVYLYIDFAPLVDDQTLRMSVSNLMFYDPNSSAPVIPVGPDEDSVLTRITVENAPAPESYPGIYQYGGLDVYAWYSNDTYQKVSSECTYTPAYHSEIAQADAGTTKTIGVSYTYKGVTKTSSFQTRIVDSTVAPTFLWISIKTLPTKRTYSVGEEFDLTGLVIEAVYETSGGTSTSSTIEWDEEDSRFSTTYANGYEFTAGDVGQQRVTVSFTDSTTGSTRTDTFRITVS